MRLRLVVKSGLTDKKEYTFEPGRAHFIGRSREADIIVKDQQASRRHCALEASPDGQWTLADQDSSNGTYVNRQRTSTRVLEVGDLIQVGKTSFEVELEGAPKPAPAEAKAPEAKAPDPETIVLPPPAQGDKPAAKPAPAPTPAPAPAPAPGPAPQPAAQEGARDEDLEDLFSFLDKVDAEDRPAARESSTTDEEEEKSVRHEPPPSTPPPREPPKDEGAGKDEDGALFDLLDKAKPPEPNAGKPEPPPEPKPKKRGGLLGFLRRKRPS
jgi:pSer/pThr/pTyr-binding forkhead associated (FHA) protein